ncbi:MAG: RNA-binding S4 domain-containing protein [Bacteroidetes bacterium]|nr:MAG: RNA-binding S4 domain-containing protein [Bacteroidota bacterium]
MLEFKLQGHPFIQLNDLLKVLNLVGTGGEANMRIVAGEVRVNGGTEIQKRKKIRSGDTVEFGTTQILVR